MNDIFHRWALRLGDWLFEWLLALPRDVALLMLAAGLAGSLLGLRRLLASVDVLQQVQADLQRLRQLVRTAKQERDRIALRRHRRNRALVTWIKVKAELPVVMVSLIPCAALLTWCAQRLDYLPIRGGAAIHLCLQMPASAAGQVAHVVPPAGWEAIEGWVQQLEAEPLMSGGGASARWQLQPSQSPLRTDLQLRIGAYTLVHPVVVGENEYEAPVREHPHVGRTIVEHARYRPFGIDSLRLLPGLPPWLAGLLAVLLPMYFGGRWLLDRGM